MSSCFGRSAARRVVGTGSVEVACLTRLAKMARSQPTVEISAGKSVEFKPGDYHVMLLA